MNLDFPEKEVLEGEGEPGQEAVSDRDLVVEPQGVVEDVHLESRVVVDVSKGTEERVRLSVFAKPEVLHEESIDRRGILLARREIEVLERHAPNCRGGALRLDSSGHLHTAHRGKSPDF